MGQPALVGNLAGDLVCSHRLFRCLGGGGVLGEDILNKGREERIGKGGGSILYVYLK